jgi:hypothetical protein
MRERRRVWEFPAPVARGITTDSLKRVTGSADKREVLCPKQDKRTAVLLIIGQSNAANFASRAYRSRHADAIVNFFDGRCYVARSPLLGADGPWGEYWTEVANRLVSLRAYDRVILIASAISSSSINEWRENPTGDDDSPRPSPVFISRPLNAMLMAVISDVQRRYVVTHVLWHQGESDTDMPAVDYRRGFLSLLSSLRSHGVLAPIFVSVTSTRRGENPPVVEAQRQLPDQKLGIFAGVDTDALVEPDERNETGHFGPKAEEKVIQAWISILSEQAR